MRNHMSVRNVGKCVRCFNARLWARAVRTHESQTLGMGAEMPNVEGVRCLEPKACGLLFQVRITHSNGALGCC